MRPTAGGTLDREKLPLKFRHSDHLGLEGGHGGLNIQLYKPTFSKLPIPLTEHTIDIVYLLFLH